MKISLNFKKSLLIILGTVSLSLVQVLPTQAALSDCTFRGVNAQEYYKCQVNIQNFNVNGNTFTQPNGKGCVWKNSQAGYHFTSATGDETLGDVHITLEPSGKHCGLNIVGDLKCDPTSAAEDTCSNIELTDAVDTCEAFLIAGNCKFD